MTASSDLDLMLIYDHDLSAELSGGQKPLSPNQYFARLTQRLITALSAPTAEGTLYEVDLRLRPSGSKGPVAVGFSSFVSYQKDEAWTWEKLALTRARFVAGEPELQRKLELAIWATLCEPRDHAKTLKDVRDMRNLMLAEHAKLGLWDIKRAKGGLVEIEFIAQYLQLISGNSEMLDTNTLKALGKIVENDVLPAGAGSELVSACQLFQRLTQILRLCVADQYNPEKSAKSLNEAVARAAGMPDIAATEALLADTQSRVASIFNDIIGR